MKINLSYKVTKGKVVDEYYKTLKGWNNKDVLLEDIHKLMLNSNIQYSNLKWNNGHKGSKQLDMSSVDCIIYDIDEDLTISQFQNLFKKYTYFLATTKSHQKKKKGLVCDRYRVIFPVINISKDFDVLARAMELIIPSVDEQTLTPTGAYLGHNEGIYIENKGTYLDLHKANALATEQLKEEARLKAEKIIVPKELQVQVFGRIDLDELKNNLTREIVIDVLTDIGIEVEGNKCSIRDERTKSCKIYGDGGMKDFGSNDRCDVFSIVMDKEDMSFREAIKYVAQYV